jgi:catechol-2,3-dioxygenase
MKRFHVHVQTDNLDQQVEFYSQLFNAKPSIKKADYAKWMLDDPKLNFALSATSAIDGENNQHRKTAGISHLGVEFEDESQLVQAKNQLLMSQRGRKNDAQLEQFAQQPSANCCYANSNKFWLQDPQDIAWEFFHTSGTTEQYGCHDNETTIKGLN